MQHPYWNCNSGRLIKSFSIPSRTAFIFVFLSCGEAHGFFDFVNLFPWHFRIGNLEILLTHFESINDPNWGINFFHPRCYFSRRVVLWAITSLWHKYHLNRYHHVLHSFPWQCSNAPLARQRICTFRTGGTNVEPNARLSALPNSS